MCTTCPDFKVGTNHWKVFDDQTQRAHEDTAWHRYYARTHEIISLYELEPPDDVGAIENEVATLRRELMVKMEQSASRARIKQDALAREHEVKEHLGQLRGGGPQHPGGSEVDDPGGEGVGADAGQDAGPDTGGSGGEMMYSSGQIEDADGLQWAEQGTRLLGDVELIRDSQVHAIPNVGTCSLE